MAYSTVFDGMALACSEGTSFSQRHMHEDEKGLVESVAAAIREHLEAHPLSADTAEGVARWWLAPADPSVSLVQVQCALRLLESRDEVRRVELVDGTMLYSNAPVDRH